MFRAFRTASLLASAVAIIAAPVLAQTPTIPGMPTMPGASGLSGISGMSSMGAPVKNLLAQASDSALDKLAQPGAFSADSAIRIGLPALGGIGGGMGKGLGGAMKLAGQSGVGGDLDASLNAAAGQAAGTAKPIFRAAIQKMTLADAKSIAMGGNTGATAYLKTSAGDAIRAQMSPLIRSALGKTGALSHMSQLQGLGFSEATLIDYVTGKTSDGVFTYMGREEAKLRQNPMGMMQH